MVQYHTCFNGGFEIPFGLRRERWFGEGCKAVGLVSNFGIAIMKESTMCVGVTVDVIYKFRVQASLGTCIAHTYHYKNSATCAPGKQKARSVATKTSASIHVGALIFVWLFAIRVFVRLNTVSVYACVNYR